MHCASCGSTIPDGQGLVCSMCYGDIDYGRDSYSRTWAAHEERQRHERATVDNPVSETVMTNAEQSVMPVTIIADLDRASAASRVGAASCSGGEEPQPDPGHHRRLVYSAGHWFFLCTCSYVSLGYVASGDAEMAPCPIQQLERESAARRRRLYDARRIG